MANKTENLPFPRGESHPYSAFSHLLGREYVVEDTIYNTGKMVTLRLVRNGAAIAALPARLQISSLTAGQYSMVTTGMAAVTGAESYPADELLPAAGAAVDDCYYLVVDGPSLIAQGVTTGAKTLIAVGDKLIAQTAATTGATTAGRVELQSFDAATTNVDSVVAIQLNGLIGRAMSAKTTSEGGNVLVNVGKW